MKVDGLPFDMVESFVRERDPLTGKSRLPWIEHVFYQRGTRLTNFYVRSISLSAPSWSLLDTGQHLQIKGNIEYDRYTLHSYDYLAPTPTYMKNIVHKRVDMPGCQVLDDLGVPLLIDAYDKDERYIGFQIFQRGIRWLTLLHGLENRFASRSPRELMYEWTTGFEWSGVVFEQLERELIEKLNNPRIKYLDLLVTDFDHAAHLSRDHDVHLQAMQRVDATVGRIWTAVQQSPLADETVLVLVSDHGINTDEHVYSQQFNLAKFFQSSRGGGHHVITKRRELINYAIKGVSPPLWLATATSKDSYYLRGQSDDYPTALLDIDGDERASIQLRDSDLNVLHILFQQLKQGNLSAELRSAATQLFFSTIDEQRPRWQKDVDETTEELAALDRQIETRRTLLAKQQPKQWTPEDMAKGRNETALRLLAQLDSWRAEEMTYTEYLRTLKNLLALKPKDFDPMRLRIADFIAKRAMGDHNTIYKLQNYVVGLAPNGLALAADGSLDAQKSFIRIDYPALLHDIAVRNNVQTGVGSHPVDFIAIRIPAREIGEALSGDLSTDQDVVWLYGGSDRQALVLSRLDGAGKTLLRYVPIAHLEQDASGHLSCERIGWRKDLPLRMWEDAELNLPPNHESWLSAWHTDEEWLQALHQTKYSNGMIGLQEYVAFHPLKNLGQLNDPQEETNDERLVRRFRWRQRLLAEADMHVLASDHWNFNMYDINAGGNHGSFFRISTHSTLMFAGGARTGIGRGRVIEEPYDSLSLVPTLLTLTGQIINGRPTADLTKRGFTSLPGPIIRKLIEDGN
jgi:hypothetical protein